MPIHATQHLRPVRGGSQSHLLRASDHGYYVTKFQDNPQGLRILANEMFASHLGRWLRLPMPTVEVLEVSESLIQNSPGLRFEIGGVSKKYSGGKHLGCLYVADPLTDAVFDYLPEGIFPKVKNAKDFARVLVLDKWLANADGRQAIFSKKTSSHLYNVTFIDKGYCFNAVEWSFPDLPLHGVYCKNHVYADVRGWEDFEPALSKAENMDIDTLWFCTEAIPPEWYEAKTAELERLVETVHRRRTNIRALITAFRHSSRNPFPNWHETDCISVPTSHAECQLAFKF